MDSFAISDLQRFSGVKAHTIRVWEQRYQALQPERSEGNTRYYNGHQLRRLLNIVSLMSAGYRISDLSVMSDQKLGVLLSAVPDRMGQHDAVHEYFISQMIASSIEFNEWHLEKLFSACILKYGIRETYLKVLYPVLARMGLMWAESSISPAQEHFISNLFRLKLSVAIDALPPAADSWDSWVLFLPEDEFHEIGLLFSNFIIRQAGKRVVYLGASTAFESLEEIAEIAKPKHFLFFLVHRNDPAIMRKYVNRLVKRFPSVDINIAGNERLVTALQKGKSLHWIKSVTDLEQKLI